MRRGEEGPKKHRIEGPPQPVRASGSGPAFTPGCGGGREGQKIQDRRTTTTSESIRGRTGFHSWMWRGEGGPKNTG